MTLLSSAASLLFVFALLGGMLFLLRRAEQSHSARRHLQVLESAPLGSNKTLALVKVGSRCFLVGATAKRITLLGETQLDELPEAVQPERPSPWRFSRFLGSGADHAETSAKAP